MSSNDIAIRVEGLSKCYEIYAKPRDRLKQFLLRRLQRLLGIEPKQYFREFWAVKDVSFEIKKGETVGIIGRNGSGKSTLLQMICGTLSPTTGNILTHGRIAALLELGSGFNPEFTGRENVYMNASVLGLSTEETDLRFADIVSFADIGQSIDQPVKTYSSGMIVRLAFAVAINVDPQILVVDEALSVGDELFQRKCFSRIETIKNNGATILFVSHSASTIVQLCNRAILIDYGKLILNDTPRAVIKQYHRIIFSKNSTEIDVNNSVKRLALDDSSEVSKDESEDEPLGSYIEELADIKPLRYENHGGRIIYFALHDNKSNKVNLVPTGFSGFVKMVVMFNETFPDVVFGFHLKSTTGLEVAGLSYPPSQEPLISVAASDTIEVSWKVKMPLAPGTYFFTFGVRSVSDGGFIDRIVDGGIVKIIDKSNYSAFGLFDILDADESSAIRLTNEHDYV
jgi:lipopolysaccharide transport system ATP-binding protein